MMRVFDIEMQQIRYFAMNDDSNVVRLNNESVKHPYCGHCTSYVNEDIIRRYIEGQQVEGDDVFEIKE
jgi:hypothetical protein